MADVVYATVLERIVSGEYSPNSKLPTEADFARELKTSRPVIRAAIARLRESGLVVSRRGSGSYVLKRPDDSFLKFAPIESIADIQLCYEYRIMLEGEAAYFAAQRAKPEHLHKMEVELERMDEAVRTRTLAVEEDYRFHLVICEATDNHFILRSYLSITEASQMAMNLARSLSLQSRSRRLIDVQEEHHDILSAIRDHDGKKAKALMRNHIGNARRRVFEGPEK
jgi:DNA-binding FadR family transcriptional regulator